MKINNIKNGVIFGFSASLTMILVGISYAAWNDVINSGDPLTATAWNDLVIKVSELNNFSFSSGNIGIGEQNPDTQIHMTSARPSITLEDNDGKDYEIITNGDGFSIDEKNIASRLFIRDNGNIGIATTSPDATLDVNGTIRAEQLCDETGANCQDLSTDLNSGGIGNPVTYTVATVYQASEDGILVVVPSGSGHSYHSIYVGTASNALTELRGRGKAYAPSGSLATTTVPIRSGEYFRINNDYGNPPVSITFWPL